VYFVNRNTTDWHLIKNGHVKRLRNINTRQCLSKQWNEDSDEFREIMSHIEVIEDLGRDMGSCLFDHCPNLHVIHSYSCSAAHLITRMIQSNSISTKIQMIFFTQHFTHRFSHGQTNILDHPLCLRLVFCIEKQWTYTHIPKPTA